MSPEMPPEQRILGSLRSQDGTGVVRMQDRFALDVAEVWSALTDPARISQWYGRVSGDLRPGGEFALFVDTSEWDGAGRVDVCEPGQRLLVTTWETDASWQQSQEGSPPEQVLEATLTGDGGATDLVIEVRGMPLELIAFYGAGWQTHIESLAAHLDGTRTGGASFDELVPAYQQLAALLPDVADR